MDWLKTQPFHIMAKPTGAACNLDCSYCFYLEKSALYETKGPTRMSSERLEIFIRDYIQSQTTETITFAWQGGEPTLMGVDFFREAVKLQQRYANGHKVENALQTNGTRLNDEWGTFLAENGFLVGISIDGPKPLHDRYRLTRSGSGSFDDVMRGLNYLRKHNVEFNTLTCVHRGNEHAGREVYRFLRKSGSRYMQFIPIVERLPAEGASCKHGLKLAAPGEEEGAVTSWSVSPKGHGRFLSDVFDEWKKKDIGRYYVRDFDCALGNWLNMGSSMCIHAETCGRALAIEHDGYVYSCDHYVYPEYRLGRIGESPLSELVDTPKQKAFGEDKKASLCAKCRDCRYRFACGGDCPKHRFVQQPGESNKLSYLCPSYMHFFSHIRPTIEKMAADWRRNQGNR